MITEDDAKALFEPIRHELTKMILDSWNKIHKSDLHFKSRSRACLMWDETFYRANIAWCDSPHIEKIEEKESQTAHYWINSTTLFRIKKGDRKGYTSNFPTQTALEFHHPQSELFGLVDKLEVTYVPTQDEVLVEDIAVVHRIGDHIDFRFSILDAANVQAIITPPASGPEPQVDSGIAKLKPEVAAESESESTNDES
jgi:hypothetical protein